MKLSKLALLLPTSLLAMLFAVVITGCKKDTYQEIKGVCPIIDSTNPSNLATNVNVNSTLRVMFNTKMNAATLNQDNFSLIGDTKVAGTFSYNESNLTMSFIPQQALQQNKTYTAKVHTGVKDKTGNALQQEYIWTFSTGGTISPLVIATSPTNGAVAVPLNKTITATFNMPMNPNSITATSFLIKTGTTAVNGTLSYTNNTASFAPSANLIANAIYSATITTGAASANGTQLSTSFSWTFTTGANLAPTVILTDPFNNATSVPLSKIITATFSEAMDPTTINALNFIIKQGNQIVPGAITFAGNVLTFTPANNLLSGSTYAATITTGAKTIGGNALASDYIWTFNTIASLGAPFVNLNTVERFGIIAGVGVSNNAGFSEIHDLDVGISPGVRASITGFPPAVIVNGASYASDDLMPVGTPAMLIQAKQDLTTAYLFAEAATLPAPASVSGDLGGQTLAPGIYKSTSTLLIQNGNLTLDAQGDQNAVWIFQIASAFTTVGGAGGSIILTGGAQAKNIFWQTGSSATIGDFTSFKGNVLAMTSITMNTAANAVGRMLARNGSVVLTSSNIINKP